MLVVATGCIKANMAGSWLFCCVAEIKARSSQTLPLPRPTGLTGNGEIHDKESIGRIGFAHG